MNCLEFRRTVGADPNHASAESLAHRAECPTCEKYAQEMLRLNGLIKQALEVPVPAQTPIKSQTRIQPRWFAMAASAVLAIGLVVSILLLGTPRESLASAVVEHLAHEPHAMTATQLRISAQSLDAALRAKGLRLSQPLSDVSYLQSCLIRGHFVPHIVVQTESGPVTVLLLTEEKAKRTERFDEEQYHGVVMPMSRGALAVIATDVSVVDAVAAKVRVALGE